MARIPYQPKPFLSDLIHDAANTVTQDGGADMVVVTGYYGEKGVAFYPYESSEDPESRVGFTLLGRDLPPKHYNMTRDQAAALTALLVRQFNLNVFTEIVTTYNIIVE